MPEIGMSGLMSGDGKRGDGHRPPSYRARPRLYLSRRVGYGVRPKYQEHRSEEAATMKRRERKCGPCQPGDRMNRREVLAGLLLAFITESAQAQQSGRNKVYRIATD